MRLLSESHCNRRLFWAKANAGDTGEALLQNKPQSAEMSKFYTLTAEKMHIVDP